MLLLTANGVAWVVAWGGDPPFSTRIDLMEQCPMPAMPGTAPGSARSHTFPYRGAPLPPPDHPPARDGQRQRLGPNILPVYCPLSDTNGARHARGSRSSHRVGTSPIRLRLADCGMGAVDQMPRLPRTGTRRGSRRFQPIRNVDRSGRRQRLLATGRRTR